MEPESMIMDEDCLKEDEIPRSFINTEQRILPQIVENYSIQITPRRNISNTRNLDCNMLNPHQSIEETRSHPSQSRRQSNNEQWVERQPQR
jgi:hypothetical protein